MWEGNVKVNMNVKVTEEDIDDIMTTVIEGGINYWCCECNTLGERRGDCRAAHLAAGGQLELFVDEPFEENPDGTDKERYILTRAKVMKGITEVLKTAKGGHMLYEGGLDCGYIDAEVADVIVQYGLFGEVVYG